MLELTDDGIVFFESWLIFYSLKTAFGSSLKTGFHGPLHSY